MIAKSFILFTMFIILFCLGSGLYNLLTDKGRSTRTAKALTWRVTLSVSLFLLLIAGMFLGYIQPHPPGF